MEKIGKIKYTMISFVVCLGVIFNFLSWHSLGLGIFFGLIYILFYSFIFGSIFIAKKGWQVIMGLLFFISLIAIFGALTIYLYQFNNYIFILLILLIPIILLPPYYYITPKEKFSLKKVILEHFDKILDRREPKINTILVFAYLTLAIIGFLLLFYGQTTTSIQSPWQVIFGNFIILYFLATLILLTYLLLAKRTKLPLALLVTHTFLSTAVALIVYKIGYGFDPFIHQAGEKIISTVGTITPTPLYYLGQYALVVFLHKLTLVDIILIDKLLVPVLTAIFLPSVTYFVFQYWLKKNYALVLALLVLIIPFPGLIMTTPQNLANLYFILTILLSLLYFRNLLPVSLFYLLAVTTIAIHPLAGIPLLITIFLFNLFKTFYESYHKHLNLFLLVAILFTFVMPLAFILNGSALEFNKPTIKLPEIIPIHLINKFDLTLDLVYLIKLNKVLLALLIIAVGIFYLKKHKLLRNNAAYLISALIIFANFLVVKYLLTFPNLQDYDQADFINRINLLAFYILLPIFLIGLHLVIKKFWEKDLFGKVFIVLMAAGFITVSFYLSYPRLNQYEPAKFFSLSDSDLRAVGLIEQSANPNHVVLANQMIGVGAIKEFGFKKYYNGQFYYSMPNDNPHTLYDYYLDMIYQGAKKETMLAAMDEAGVDEAYFVLNNYWNNAEKIAQAATQSADQVYIVDEGTVMIFKYNKK